MCGTCQLTYKMLEVVDAAIPDLPRGKDNFNYGKEIPSLYERASVPCPVTTTNRKQKTKR